MFASIAAFVLMCLASCGSGTSKVDEFIPSRIVVIGDSYSYLGSPATNYQERITVNDGTINNWAIQVATNYGLSTAAADGKLISGIVNAGTGTEFTIAQIKNQIGALTGSNTPKAGDLLLVMGGAVDIFNKAITLGASPTDAALTLAKADIKTQAHSLRDYVRSLVNPSGLNHIMLLAVPSLAGSPFSKISSLDTTLEALAREFNDSLKENFGTQKSGEGIRLYDAEVLFKGVTYLHSLGITNRTDKFCDGTTAARSLILTACTDTVNLSYLYATDKYPTPIVHRLLGNQVYNTMRGYSGW
ncbi:MAG: hypothetical protein EXR35_04735 [Limnohabitans sp.]|nr:hypothetical protein [Limnohabitans sp.]